MNITILRLRTKDIVEYNKDKKDVRTEKQIILNDLKRRASYDIKNSK